MRNLKSAISMISNENFDPEEIAKEIGLDFDTLDFDIEQFRKGIEVEFEHGTVNAQTNITDDDPVMTAKIALAHLYERPDYYILLAEMESAEEE